MQEPVHLNKITERLGTDPLGKLILRLSLPSIVSMVAVSLYNLVDTFWVGKLGYQSVAAVVVTLPFFILALAIGTGTGVGINAIASRKFGERDVEAANRVVGQVFFLSLALGGLLLLAANLYTTQILRLCGATPDIIDLGTRYLRVLGWGMPFLIFNLISRNVFQASGDAIRPMIIIVTSQVINAIAAPILIFGWAFIPRLEMEGAALGVVLANVVGLAMALWYFMNGKTAYSLRWKYFVPSLKEISAIYSVGLPSIIMEASEGVVFGLFNHVVSAYGSLALAGIGIAGRIADLAFMPIIGTSHGLLPIIGYSLGAKLYDRLWGAVRKSAIWLALFLICATVFIEIFPVQIISFFNNDPELLKLAGPGMRIFCSAFVAIGPTVIFITTFQGLSKSRDAMFLSITRQFVFFIPGLFLLSHWFGLTGIWLSMPFSDTAGFVTAGFWMLREYKLNKKSLKLAETGTSNVSVSRSDTISR